MTTSYDMPMSDLPTELSELRDLALDLRWFWSHAADKLWQRIDPDTWDRTHNPWLILQTVSKKYLLQLASDTDFISLLSELRREQNIAHERPAWFQQNHLKSASSSIAYFSMEFGLDGSLPICSGSLGVHVLSWDSPESDRLWTDVCGKGRWREDLQDLETAILKTSDERLWAMRTQNRMVGGLRHGTGRLAGYWETENCMLTCRAGMLGKHMISILFLKMTFTNAMSAGSQNIGFTSCVTAWRSCPPFLRQSNFMGTLK